MTIPQITLTRPTNLRDVENVLKTIAPQIGLLLLPQAESSDGLPEATELNKNTLFLIREVAGTSPAILYINLAGGESTTGYAWKELFRGGVVTNSGTGTIANGTTSDEITHGLDITPSLEDIIITLGENPTNTPGAIWVDNIGATTFQVNCENDPGASGLDFGWRVISP